MIWFDNAARKENSSDIYIISVSWSSLRFGLTSYFWTARYICLLDISSLYIEYIVWGAKAFLKQANKQTNKRKNERTNEETNKQTKKITISKNPLLQLKRARPGWPGSYPEHSFCFSWVLRTRTLGAQFWPFLFTSVCFVT